MQNQSVVEDNKAACIYFQNISAAYAEDAMYFREVGAVHSASLRQEDARVYHLAAVETLRCLIGSGVAGA